MRVIHVLGWRHAGRSAGWREGEEHARVRGSGDDLFREQLPQHARRPSMPALLPLLRSTHSADRSRTYLEFHARAHTHTHTHSQTLPHTRTRARARTPHTPTRPQTSLELTRIQTHGHEIGAAMHCSPALRHASVTTSGASRIISLGHMFHATLAHKYVEREE